MRRLMTGIGKMRNIPCILIFPAGTEHPGRVSAVYFTPLVKRGQRTIEEDLFRFDSFWMLVREDSINVLSPVTEISVLRVPV